MPTTSTIDQHAVNRAKLVERLAVIAARLDWTGAEVALIQWARDQITDQSGEAHISPTTWACLVIRLGGPSEPDPTLSPAEVERTAEYVALIEDAMGIAR